MKAVFAMASCQYPAGLLDDSLAYASLRRLAARRAAAARTPTKLNMLLLLGDQVYVDATAGLFDPTAPDRYAPRYDAFGEAFQRFSGMRVKMMLDDHEIEDNWEPEGTGFDQNLAMGRAYYARQRDRFGPSLRSPEGDSTHPLWYHFEDGGLPFFVCDTRTERTMRTAATIEKARIMSEAQFGALLGWLEEQAVKRPGVPKFVASPAILLPRRLRATRHVAAALHSDAWDGYPRSFHRLLEHIGKRKIRNVVFLSGDEHLSCVASAKIYRPDGAAVDVHSIHSSALYAPFPFANSIEADFAHAQDTFPLSLADGAGGYRCTLGNVQFVPGDGFAVLSVREEGQHWKLGCEFDRAAGGTSIDLVLP